MTVLIGGFHGVLGDRTRGAYLDFTHFQFGDIGVLVAEACRALLPQLTGGVFDGLFRVLGNRVEVLRTDLCQLFGVLLVIDVLQCPLVLLGNDRFRRGGGVRRSCGLRLVRRLRLLRGVRVLLVGRRTRSAAGIGRIIRRGRACRRSPDTCRFVPVLCCRGHSGVRPLVAPCARPGLLLGLGGDPRGMVLLTRGRLCSLRDQRGIVVAFEVGLLAVPLLLTGLLSQ